MKLVRLSLFAAVAVATCYSQAKPQSLDVAGGPIPMHVLMQGPADTETDLQVICLFRSSPVNALHGSLIEGNEKLSGLLDRIRKPNLFRGELGETLLVAPPRGGFGAKKLLIIGLGDSQTFSPERMQLIGEILYVEANRLGVAHPFFAPTILDGGVEKYTTGQVSEHVIIGFLQAAAVEKALKDANASAGQSVAELTYLAGPKYAPNTREGIEKAFAGPAHK